MKKKSLGSASDQTSVRSNWPLIRQVCAQNCLWSDRHRPNWPLIRQVPDHCPDTSDLEVFSRPCNLSAPRTCVRSKMVWSEATDQYFVVQLLVEKFPSVRLLNDSVTLSFVSKVKIRTSSYQLFDVHLHVRNFSNILLRCNFMATTVTLVETWKYLKTILDGFKVWKEYPQQILGMKEFVWT